MIDITSPRQCDVGAAFRNASFMSEASQSCLDCFAATLEPPVGLGACGSHGDTIRDAHAGTMFAPVFPVFADATHRRGGKFYRSRQMRTAMQKISRQDSDDGRSFHCA
ncbi:hypothetical protein CQW49_12390 [Methylosinus trichosporium OB3b]|uniref:Uncharacterized protein n=1 Tax=Methylosinus trichosporium (strain ATCC 35070 / NCIMB 11131 / UNIQEM 75 / OB3b) TaxID=595536 RepID=A0A2D2D0V3_METT3|nr:hypothetical protein CQW49_12390 [Methylosinus trichosporium OB3b]